MKPHRARILAMQAVFQHEFHKRPLDELFHFDWLDFTPDEREMDLARKIIEGTYENLLEIDETIRKFSLNWDFSRISHVSKSILRISLYQLFYLSAEYNYKIIIDEALKLAKEYAEDDAVRFINGLLDSAYKERL